MKKVMIAAVLLIALFLASCMSEEEKAIRDARNMYEDAIEGIADMLADAPMPDDDKAEVKEMSDAALAELKDASTLEEVQETGGNSLGGMLFMAMFVVDEDALNEYAEDMTDRYPEFGELFR